MLFSTVESRERTSLSVAFPTSMRSTSLCAVSSARATDPYTNSTRIRFAKGCSADPKDAKDANCLVHQGVHLSKYGSISVRLIKNLTTHCAANDESHFREVLKFTLDCANAAIYFACDLARVEGLTGLAIQHGEDGAARASEQKVRQTVVCTHSENNCAQDENTIQGSNIGLRMKT